MCCFLPGLGVASSVALVHILRSRDNQRSAVLSVSYWFCAAAENTKMHRVILCL